MLDNYKCSPCCDTLKAGNDTGLLEGYHTVRVKFWCNAGYTEEVVEVRIYEGAGSEDDQIQEEFLDWLDRNEDCGYSKVEHKESEEI